MKFKSLLSRLLWILSTQMGIDPKKMVRAVIGLPRYFQHYVQFRTAYSGTMAFFPCLHEWREEGTTKTQNEYFWQDLLVARHIFQEKPTKHVDIGSRIDGFVAHVACFREIEVLDIRPISTTIPAVLFKQADLMQPTPEWRDYCDSLSCLHTLEHFGLGRYGDPIDPRGHECGIQNMSYMIKTGGLFYLSIPIGVERVEFNAHRVFNPKTIIEIAQKNQLAIKALTIIEDGWKVTTSPLTQSDLDRLSQQRYALGVFTFTKI